MSLQVRAGLSGGLEMFDEGAEALPFECIIVGDTVRVTGDIDLGTAPLFYEVIAKCTKQIGAMPTIDLRGVEYLDSAGIQALVNAHNEEIDCHGAPKLIGVHPNVMRIMRMVGLDRVFEIHGANDSNGFFL